MNRDVFINCPFTRDYSAFFDAVTFTIIYCGYVPRCSREFGDNLSSRLDNICALIEQSRLGIHDISYTELSKISTGEELPRFNMPLELGLFLGAKKFGDALQRAKTCLVFDREQHRYQKFISDISGQDISSHENSPAMMVSTIAKWLRDDLHDNKVPGGTYIMERFAEFQTDLPTICAEMRITLDELTFQSFRITAQEWIAKYESSASFVA